MKLNNRDVQAQLRQAPGWSRKGEAITRTFAFPTFADAIAFVARLAFDAEAADHHPDLTINYRKVRVTWSTHSDGGVTAKDFEGARQSDRIASRLGTKAKAKGKGKA